MKRHRNVLNAAKVFHSLHVVLNKDDHVAPIGQTFPFHTICKKQSCFPLYADLCDKKEKTYKT